MRRVVVMALGAIFVVVAIFVSPTGGLLLFGLLLLLVFVHERNTTRACPRCGDRVRNGELDCPHCEFDFRTIGEKET